MIRIPFTRQEMELARDGYYALRDLRGKPIRWRDMSKRDQYAWAIRVLPNCERVEHPTRWLRALSALGWWLRSLRFLRAYPKSV